MEKNLYRAAKGQARSPVFRVVVVFCLFAIGCCLSGCLIPAGQHPRCLSSRQEVELAASNLEDIDIRNLPLEDYPRLTKFVRLKRLQLYSINGDSATDEKLEALAGIGFTNLVDINLLNGRLITDRGIRALATIASLQELQLEGTSITDDALRMLCAKPGFRGVNVANCRGVSLTGLKIICQCEHFDEVSFSADGLSQFDVRGLLEQMAGSVKWCGIVDRDLRLDETALQVLASKKDFRLVISAKGALQYMQEL